MPKKRFTSQYSKPQSTIHPSLSTSSSSSANQNATQPTVNELISSFRRHTISSAVKASAPTVATPTLPPQIRHLLAQPETPGPRPRVRDRRRFDASGRRLPAGPAPPRSWLEASRTALLGARYRGQQRVYPTDVEHLPGLSAGEGKGRRLMDMCLRTLARDWEFIKEYEMNNLADLPTGLRMTLLSVIAVHGPEEGVGYEGLKNILLPPQPEDDKSAIFDVEEHNQGFFRLDVSGAMGHSLTFKQLIELVQKPEQTNEVVPEVSWEDSISRSLSTPIPFLTHLSLSHPSPAIQWTRLIAFAKHTPALTHLSLAFWPVPSLNPNADTTVMASRYTKDVQYGSTNYYSHSLDGDFQEASDVLRRLATKLYNLEYLDVTGCSGWIQAFRGYGPDSQRRIDWGHQWVKLQTLKAHSGLTLTESSPFTDVVQVVRSHREAVAVQETFSSHMLPPLDLPRFKRKVWVEVKRETWKHYNSLWQGNGEEEKRKRRAWQKLESLEKEVAMPVLSRTEVSTSGGFAADYWAGPILDAEGRVRDVERASVWEQ